MRNNTISDSAKLSENELGKDVKIYANAEVKRSIIGDTVTVGDSSIIIDCKLSGNNSINRRNYLLRTNIGCYTYTGIGTMIRSANVGNFCSLSWNVSIGGGDHPHDRTTTSTLNRFYFLDSGQFVSEATKELEKTFKSNKHCNVGNDVLISSNVVILRDINIGNGAIIGAGAVVTKDVEPYSIMAGVPAKKIKMRFEDKTIEILEKIQWWNWPREIIRENLDLIYSKKVDAHVLEQLTEISDSLK